MFIYILCHSVFSSFKKVSPNNNHAVERNILRCHPEIPREYHTTCTV